MELPSPAWTLADLACCLRQRLIDAVGQHDEKTIHELWTALTIIVEASYNSHSEVITGIFVDLQGYAQCAVMEELWKADPLPSIEQIHAALDQCSVNDN